MKRYCVPGLLTLLIAVGVACAQPEATHVPTVAPTLGAAQTSKTTPRPLAAAVLNPDAVVPTKVASGLAPAPTPAPALPAAAATATGTSVVEEDYLGYDIIAHRGGYYGIPSRVTEPAELKANGPRTFFVADSVADLRRQMDLSLVPAMAEEGYQGYNIIQLEDRFYAIPQEEGSFDYSKFQAGGYYNSAVGDSLNEVKKEMEGLTPLISTLVPTLVSEGYLGYNIVQLNKRYYGILQEEGSFEKDAYTAGGYERSVSGGSLREVKGEIDGMPPVNATLVATLVVEAYQGYNILQLGLRYYGIPQQEGAFDYFSYQTGRYANAVDGATLKDVKQQIRALPPAGS